MANDTVGDGLTNYQELVVDHSNPEVKDTDGDAPATIPADGGRQR